MFESVFSNVAIMLIYMLVGLFICLTKKSIAAHAKSFSGLLLYVLGPAMLINSFMHLEYSKESFIQLGKFFIISLILQILFFGVLYIIFNRKYEDAKYRILTIGGVLGNVGYLGMPIAVTVFPDNPVVACYSSIYVMSMNLIVFTIGVFLITNDKKYMSLKHAILNPTSIAIFISLPIYFFGIKFPSMVENSVDALAKMVTPMCMIILGMRLSTVKFKALFGRPTIYGACLLKLIIYPVFVFLCVNWLPFLDGTLKGTLIVLSTTPTGAIVNGLAELHECEQELAANVVLLTTILCVITIPLVVTVLI